MKLKILMIGMVFAVLSTNAFAAEKSTKTLRKPALSEQVVTLTGVIESYNGPGAETSGVAIFPPNDASADPIAELDIRQIPRGQVLSLLTGYHETPKLVQATGVYETLNEGEMKPNAKLLLVQTLQTAPAK